MDRGMLEREKALEVKRNVSEIKSRRRQRRFSRMPQYLIPVAKTPSLDFLLSAPTQHTARGEGNLTSFNQPMWIEPLYNTSLPMESVFSQEGCVIPSNQWSCDGGPAIENEDMEYNSASSHSSEIASASTLISSSLREDDARNDIKDSREAVQFGAGVDAPVPLCRPTLSVSGHHTYFSRETMSSNQVCSSSSPPARHPGGV
jgi:hypothetical protein